MSPKIIGVDLVYMNHYYVSSVWYSRLFLSIFLMEHGVNQPRTHKCVLGLHMSIRIYMGV